MLKQCKHKLYSCLCMLLLCLLLQPSCKSKNNNATVDQKGSAVTYEDALNEIRAIKEAITHFSNEIESSHEEESFEDHESHDEHDSGLTKGEVDILKKIHALNVKLRGLERMLSSSSPRENRVDEEKILVSQIKKIAKETLLTAEDMTEQKMRTSGNLIEVVKVKNDHWTANIKFKRERSSKIVELATLTCLREESKIFCELMKIQDTE